MSKAETAFESTDLSELGAEVVTKVVTDDQPTDNKNEFALTAEEVSQLTGWNIRTVYRFFRAHDEHLITEKSKGGPGGVKTLISICALPVEFQRKHQALTSRTGSSDADAEWYARQPEKIRRKVDERLAILEVWWAIEARTGKGDRTAALKAYAKKIRLSWVTVHRWEKAYKESGKPGLAPGWGAKKGWSNLSQEMLDLILDHYLHPDHPHIKARTTYDYYCIECAKRRESPVSESTVRNILKHPAIQYHKHKLIFGERKAMERFGPYLSRTRKDSYPGEAYVGDHYQVDVAVVSEDGKRAIFPWLTGWQDYFSTRIVGYNLCEIPNSDSIKLALANAILSSGIPDIVHTDNGKDYRARVLTGEGRVSERRYRVEPGDEDCRGLYSMLIITRVHSLPYVARSKTIERLFRIFAERACPAMVGHRGNSTQRRPEGVDPLIKKTREAIRAGQPVGLAHGTCMTWSEFKEIIAGFIRWMNEERPSDAEGLEGRTPLQMWQSKPEPVRTADPRALELLFLRVQNRTVKNLRIRLFKDASFQHPDLFAWHEKRVNIRYHPERLDAVYVHDPKDDHLICVAARVEKITAFDPKASEKGIQELQRMRRVIKTHEFAIARTRRDLTAAELGGYRLPEGPEPDPLEGRETVAQLTGLERPAREAEALMQAVNAEPAPAPRRADPTAFYTDPQPVRRAIVPRPEDLYTEEEET